MDPVTGGRYDSNSPESQLWIHMTAWHSILYVAYFESWKPRLAASQTAQSWCG